MVDIILSVLAGLSLASLTGLLAYPIGKALKVLDYPDPVGGRKRHDAITPLVGGVAVVAILSLMLAYLSVALMGVSQNEAQVAAWLNVIAVGTFLVGFTDDRLHLSPVPRLAVTIALFFTATAYVPVFKLEFLYFAFIDNVQFLGPTAAVFTILCLVGLVNAVNMADGKNGLVVGMSMIWALLLILYTSESLRPVYIALFSGLSVLFVFNWRGKLFLGDGGSYGLAGFIGISSIYAYNVNFTHMGAEQIVLWFLVPVLDCLRLMVSRVLVGRSPFSGDRNHLHHFLALRYGWNKGLVVYLSLVGIPSILTWFMPQATVLFIVLVTLVYWVITLSAKRKIQKQSLASA